MFRFILNKPYLPLFWKFSIAITVVVIIFGSINFSLIKDNITQTLEKELRFRLQFIINTLSGQLTNSVLFGDYLSIQTIISTALMNDSTIKYILLVNGNKEIIAHSFEQNLPEYIKENYECKDSCLYDTEFYAICHNNRLGVMQISEPLLQGALGYLYIGIDNKNILKNIDESMQIFVLMIFTFFLIGIVGAFVFSYLITKPIKLLEKFSQNLSLNNLTQKNFEIFEETNRTNLYLKKILFRDEIDNLIDTFREMLKRLTQTHNELQNLQSQLIHTEKLSTVGVLAAGLAHDINNPIAGVLNSIHRIRKNPNNTEQVTKYLVLMEESAKKIQIVVSNLMNFTRKHDIEFSNVNLNVIIEKSLLLVSHKINESNIAIQKTFEHKEYFLRGSQNHLEQLFINILLNSIDAINQKLRSNSDFVDPKISIKAHKMELNLIVEIVDNGIGIESENIERIFDTFYSTKKAEGTGLGLSIVQNILNLHKAKIEITSDYKKWTKATILFKTDFENE